MPLVRLWKIIAPSVCCQSNVSLRVPVKLRDDCRCNSKKMSYLFHALLICFSKMYIRSTQPYKPQSATVIQSQVMFLQGALQYKFIVPLNDSSASNCNLLIKNPPTITPFAYKKLSLLCDTKMNSNDLFKAKKVI